jgi:hypothetical protein
LKTKLQVVAPNTYFATNFCFLDEQTTSVTTMASYTMLCTLLVLALPKTPPFVKTLGMFLLVF